MAGQVLRGLLLRVPGKTEGRAMKTEQLPLVTFEQAKRLKELGFDYPVIRWYSANVVNERVKNHAWKSSWDADHNHSTGETKASAPTVALVLKWIREEKNIVCHVITQMKRFRLEYRFLYRLNYAQVKSRECYIGYEAAESALLDELLDILEKDKGE
jgi:hypothetical protein